MSTRYEPGARAAPGGIPLSVPVIAGNEWKYVKDCLDSGWVSSAGPYVDRFEREFAARVGAGNAVATVNGTAAIHVSLLLAGVRPDDEVLVPSLTFIAPANAVRYAGAWPVFVDAEPRHAQMDVAAAVRFLEEECERSGGEVRNRRTGRRVSALLPVHVLGHPVDMDPLLEAAGRFGLPVVEDATESLGATYRGRPVGTLGDFGCFSFNGNKMLTTGGGGMIVTSDARAAARAKYLTTQAKDDPVEYVHGEVGFNYRLTNLQAAVGCAQLERLDEHVRAKRRIAQAYVEGLGKVPGISVLGEAPWASSAFWLSTILVDEAVFGLSSRDLMKALEGDRIQTRPLWQPLHRSPAHAASARACPVADRIHREALNLPSSPDLGPTDIGRVCQAIRPAAEG